MANVITRMGSAIAKRFARATPTTSDRVKTPTPPTPEVPVSKAMTLRYRPHQYFTVARDLPPFTFETIRVMLQDPAIKLNLAMRAAPVQSVEFAYVDGVGPDGKPKWTPGVKARNEVVAAWVLRQLNTIWKNYLPGLLRNQVWGWSAGEVTLRLTEANLIEIDELLPRHAKDCRLLETHSDGKRWGIEVANVVDAGKVQLPYPYCYFVNFRPEDGEKYSSGILLGAYSPWADKSFNGGALDTRRLYMHKDAYGGMKIGYPNEALFVDGKPDGIPARDIAMQIAEQRENGGTITYPSERDVNGEPKWIIEDATVGAAPTHILQFPKDLDDEIRQGMEIPDGAIQNDGAGGWDGKALPLGAFYAGLDIWVTQLLVDIRKTLDPLILMNFGCAEEYEISHKPLALQAMEQQAEKRQGGPTEQPQEGSQEQANPYRMSLDPVAAVGRGVMDAGNLVKAARTALRLSAAPTDDDADEDTDDERATAIAELLTHLYGDDAESHFDEIFGGPVKMAAGWSSIDHPRGANGRFIAKNSAEAVSTAKDAIRSTLNGRRTSQTLKTVTEHLSILSTKQLHELKREYNVKAGGAKPALIAKIANRIHGTAGDTAEPTTQAPTVRENGTPTAPSPKDVHTVPVASLKTDAKRFQYKVKDIGDDGVTGELKGVGKWNPELAGAMLVWRDPANGQDYVVNGHHRHELANRLGAEEANVRYIDAPNAKEARARGALANIAEGRGSAVDAAKYLRDSGQDVEHLRAAGISLAGKVANDATILKNLADKPFQMVTQGTLDEGKAIAVAKHLKDHALQNTLFKKLEAREEDGKDWSNREIETAAKKMNNAGKYMQQGEDLFGMFADEKSTFDQEVELESHVGRLLAQEANDYHAVSNQRRADRVADAGNTLAVDENAKRAKNAVETASTFDREAGLRGPVSAAIKEHAAELATATTKKQREAIKAKTLESVRAALAPAIEPEPVAPTPELITENTPETTEPITENTRWHVTPHGDAIRSKGFSQGKGGGVGGSVSGEGVSVWPTEKAAGKFLKHTQALESIRTSESPIEEAEKVTGMPIETTKDVANGYAKGDKKLSDKERAVIHYQALEAPYIPANSFFHDGPAKKWETIKAEVLNGEKSKVSDGTEELYDSSHLRAHGQSAAPVVQESTPSDKPSEAIPPKQPHELTESEYLKEYGDSRLSRANHAAQVEQAIEDGETIPRSVAKEFDTHTAKHQPHMLTAKEYRQATGRDTILSPQGPRAIEEANAEHAAAVKAATAAGKNVAPEVLADYPEAKPAAEPKWAEPGSAIEQDGHTLRKGRFAGKNQWTVDDNGDPSGYKSTPAEAIEHHTDKLRKKVQANADSAKLDKAKAAIASNDYDESHIATLAGSSRENIRKQDADALLSHLGMRPTDADAIINKMRSAGLDPDGTDTYNARKLVSEAKAFDFIESADPTKRPSTKYREAAAERIHQEARKAAEVKDALGATATKFGSSPHSETATHYAGRVLGSRSNGDAHPTPTNGDVQKAVAKGREQIADDVQRMVDNAQKEGVKVTPEMLKDFPEIAAKLKPAAVAKPERELSDQEEAEKDFTDNFARVSDNPKASKSRDLHRAMGYLSKEQQSLGRKVQRGEITKEQYKERDDGMQRERDWYRDILKERGDLAASPPFSDEKPAAKPAGIEMPSRTIDNADAKDGDQLGLFGEAIKAKVKTPTLKTEEPTKARQGGLFDTHGNSNQMDLFGDAAMDHSLVYKPTTAAGRLKAAGIDDDSTHGDIDKAIANGKITKDEATPARKRLIELEHKRQDEANEYSSRTNTKPNPKHEAIGKRFGVPAAVVASILNTHPDELAKRDKYTAPSSSRSDAVGPTLDYPSHELGTAKIDSSRHASGDTDNAYVDYLRDFDPSELTTAEHEDGMKQSGSVKSYVDWIKQGHKAPPISVFDIDGKPGKMQSTNRRRLLAAQMAGAKTIRGWHGKTNPETGNPLTYGDIIRAHKETK